MAVRPRHGGVPVIEKVINNMTVPTRAHVPFARSGGDALPYWTGRNTRDFTRADMIALHDVRKAPRHDG
jgi:hypothetical protein